MRWTGANWMYRPDMAVVYRQLQIRDHPIKYSLIFLFRLIRSKNVFFLSLFFIVFAWMHILVLAVQFVALVLRAPRNTKNISSNQSERRVERISKMLRNHHPGHFIPLAMSLKKKRHFFIFHIFFVFRSTRSSAQKIIIFQYDVVSWFTCLIMFNKLNGQCKLRDE